MIPLNGNFANVSTEFFQELVKALILNLTPPQRFTYLLLNFLTIQ